MLEEGTRIGVAVLGAGGRGTQVTGNLLRDSDRNVEVLSVFDPDVAQSRAARTAWDSPNAHICDSFETAIAMEGVSWVLVFSPNVFHREHVEAGFEAGRHVFSEKPLATSIEDCVALHKAHEASGKHFATGFVMRYAPIYRRLKSLIEEGALGQVLSIDANENIAPSHGGYIMMNWRRHAKLSGPHILEKCCHDIDVLNWYTDSVPGRVAAFHGRDFFVPANASLVEKYGPDHFAAWPDPHRDDGATPFTDDSDLMDNLVSILEYRNGIRAQFQATMSNAMPERRIYVSGSEGTATVELYSSSLRYRRMGDEAVRSIDFGSDGHGGGDDFIMKELYHTMANDAPPTCSGEEGLRSAVVALAIDQSAREGQIIDLTPTWESLGVE
jgi:predicted dehydrogenase